MFLSKMVGLLFMEKAAAIDLSAYIMGGAKGGVSNVFVHLEMFVVGFFPFTQVPNVYIAVTEVALQRSATLTDILKRLAILL